MTLIKQENNPFGCSCSFMVCGCAYPPGMMKIMFAVGLVLFITSVIVIFNENYCTYKDFKDCNAKHYRYCQEIAKETPWYNNEELVINNCLCQSCEKCMDNEKNKAIHETMCRISKNTIKSTNNKTITARATQAIKETANKYGINLSLYGF